MKKRTIELTIREYYQLKTTLTELAVKFTIIIKKGLVFLTTESEILLKLGF